MNKKNTTDNTAQGAAIVAENTNSETKNTLNVVKGLNLEQTLKIVEELHLKKRKRDSLEKTIDKLAMFEIAQEEENLDFQGYYNGCSLELKDDGNGKFITKNPVVIKMVVEYLKTSLMGKLTEVEAEIIIPAA